MSGPTRTNEIEDFVSSVRRLVSVDAHPRVRSRDLGQDRLVLTPALRVVPDAVPEPVPLVLTTPAEDERPAPAAAVADAVLETAEASPAFEAEWEEELWSEPEPSLSELALGAEEAEVIEDVAPDLVAAALEPEAPAGAPAADAASPEAGSPWAEVGEAWLDDAVAPATSTAAAADAEQVGAAAAAQASRPDVLKLSAADMLTDGDGNPLTVLDEAALQQIIRQLIREELKGVLGERITHSVRKLVRAEINRALAAHALD